MSNRDFYDRLISPDVRRKAKRRRREPVTIGAALLAGAEAAGATGAVAFGASSLFGISGAWLVGSVVLGAELIGKQTALRPAEWK